MCAVPVSVGQINLFMCLFGGLLAHVNVDEFLDERFKMVFVGICCTIHKCTYMYTVLISVYVFKLTCLCACLVCCLCV